MSQMAPKPKDASGDAGYVNMSVMIVASLVAALGTLLIVLNGYWLIGGIPLTAVGLLVLAAELSA